MMKTVQTILKLESAAMFFVAIYAYYFLHLNWLFFFIFILVPDISMVGYLAGNKVGAVCYNFMHFYLFPFLLLAVGAGIHRFLLLSLSLIWIAHISLDRALGYGLKLGSFKETHLSNIGLKTFKDSNL